MANMFRSVLEKIIQATKTVTAGTSNKTITPDTGYDAMAEVIVEPTPSQEKSTTATTSTQYITPDSGKLLSKVTVSPQIHSDVVPSSYYDVAAGNTRRIDLGSIHNARYVDIRGTGGGLNLVFAYMNQNIIAMI